MERVKWHFVAQVWAVKTHLRQKWIHLRQMVHWFVLIPVPSSKLNLDPKPPPDLAPNSPLSLLLALSIPEIQRKSSSKSPPDHAPNLPLSLSSVLPLPEMQRNPA